MIRDVVGSVDAMLGGSVARSVVAHHRRRLERIGWSRAVRPPEGLWAEGDPLPRGGCSLEVLIDGEEALPRIADEIAAARSHVWLAGWQFEPDFALRRDGSSQRSCATCSRNCRSGLTSECLLGRVLRCLLSDLRDARFVTCETNSAAERTFIVRSTPVSVPSIATTRRRL